MFQLSKEMAQMCGCNGYEALEWVSWHIWLDYVPCGLDEALLPLGCIHATHSAPKGDQKKFPFEILFNACLPKKG
uniref:Uncharacterized protein n=1 Tax=Onchocerca volvulus TaxID=6282 RepID=A0A2K6W3D3_ONCVO